MWASKVERLLEYLSRWTGYEFDDRDWGAVENALPETDADRSDAWYEYPLGGAPELLVRLAKNVDGDEVEVQVRGDFDAVLAVRIETALELL